MLDDAREETVSQAGNGGPGTQEAEALAAALNHSAERVQTLWFSFLTFMLYLAIATGTTTHRMLFLESPLNLPVLNIALPLLGFYVLSPIIFVVLHFYMLLNLVLLARTAKSFDNTLARAFPEDGDANENFRMRIENTLFVQLLVGGRLEREGINAKLLSWMALITLALAPVALMLMIQIKFLPYHSEAITWLHRGLLALDLALVWTLWPGYRSGWGVWLPPMKPRWLLFTVVGTGVTIYYGLIQATFPDELIYGGFNGSWITPVNTLDLHGEGLIDVAKLALIEQTESATDSQRWAATLLLAGRDLTGANLTQADVRHVDFSGAILNRANLKDAWARKARFNNTQLRWAVLSGAQLQGASLRDAQLQGAFLRRTQLQGASLDGAQLRGAWLDGANLQGASLDGTLLQGASLDGTQLQGASLNGTQLQGAPLREAQLQGASLDGAQLQGALLDQAQVQGASFIGVCAWRADARQAAWEDTRVAHPETDPKPYEVHGCGWTAASFVALQKLIADEIPEWEVPEVNDKDANLIRIIHRLDPANALEGEDEMAKVWATRDRESPAPKAYAKSLAGQWRETGCAAEGAPYVLQALIARLRVPFSSSFRDLSGWAKDLAADFLYENCAGAHGLSDADKAKLKKLAAPAAPQAPKP